MMNKNLFLLCGSTLLLTTTALSTSAASNTVTFTCSQIEGVPATVVQTSKGDVPVIKWVSNYFVNSGWTAERRCNEVSARFQEYHSQGKLKYLTTGIKNGQNVVCVTQQDKGSCEDLLFTLKAGSNPGKTLERLLDIRKSASHKPLFETSKVYIDMEQYLETKISEQKSTDNITPEFNRINPTMKNSNSSEAVTEDNLW